VLENAVNGSYPAQGWAIWKMKVSLT